MISAQEMSHVSERVWKKVQAEHFRHGDEASAFYRSNKSRLLRNSKYRNKHIAVRDKRVVDVNSDFRKLMHRLMVRFPDRKYYVVHVVKNERVFQVGDIVLESNLI